MAAWRSGSTVRVLSVWAGHTRSCQAAAPKSDNLISVRQITATEAARRFSEVLDEVEHTGATFVITRGGRAVASLGPAPAGNGGALRTVLRRHRADPAWADEIREVRRLLIDSEPPWPD